MMPTTDGEPRVEVNGVESKVVRFCVELVEEAGRRGERGVPRTSKNVDEAERSDFFLTRTHTAFSTPRVQKRASTSSSFAFPLGMYLNIKNISKFRTGRRNTTKLDSPDREMHSPFSSAFIDVTKARYRLTPPIAQPSPEPLVGATSRLNPLARVVGATRSAAAFNNISGAKEDAGIVLQVKTSRFGADLETALMQANDGRAHDESQNGGARSKLRVKWRSLFRNGSRTDEDCMYIAFLEEFKKGEVDKFW
jgi:hypothetical protein